MSSKPRVHTLDNAKPEPFFQRVAIIGLGLLGGSWGLALKKVGFTGRIAGYARRAETRERALGVGAIDEHFADIPSAVARRRSGDPGDACGSDSRPPCTSSSGFFASRRLLPTSAAPSNGSARGRRNSMPGSRYFLAGTRWRARSTRELRTRTRGLFVNARYVLTPLKPEDLDDRPREGVSCVGRGHRSARGHKRPGDS